MFNRGRSHPDLFPHVERLIGDRDDQLDALRGQRWDAVIDNAGFFPRHARLSAELLEPNVGTYLFVSSISAYDLGRLRPWDRPEDAPIATMEDPADESGGPSGRFYGPRKALCEQEVLKVFGSERTLIIRPGIITGPGDPKDRVRHWFARAERGGEILVPGPHEGPVQYIDVRDLSGWMVRLLEDGASGVFHGVGPGDRLTSAEFVYGLVSAVDSELWFTWVDWELLLDGEEPELRYFPLVGPNAAPMMMISNQSSTGSGLLYRPLAETVHDLYAEYVALSDGSGPENFGWRGVPSSADEAELLKAWYERR